MTIGASNRNDAVGSGSTATYPYGYKIFAATDLLVTVRDPASSVEYTLTYPTHYSVTGVGVKTGGNIVLAGSGNAWQDGSGFLKNTWPISIRRVRPFTQETDIRNQGDYRASVHEDTFDNLMMVDQQQQDEIDRSMKLSETIDPDVVSATLPVPTASAFLGWNSLATAIINYAGLASVAVSSVMAAFVGSASKAAARAELGALGEADFTAAGQILIGQASGDALPVSMPLGGAQIINGKIALSVGASALTVALKGLDGNDPSASNPVFIRIPQNTAGVFDGTYAIRKMTAALSVVVSSGSTLGHTSAVACPVYFYLIDNGGVPELAVSTKFFGTPAVVSTTAEGGAGGADTRTVMYSTTARSNVSCAVIGRWKSTQTTAGTWAAVTGEQQLYPFPFKKPKRTLYTTPGENTHTKDWDVLWARLWVVGAGGGSGGIGATGASNSSASAGGNSGGKSVKTLDAADYAATETATVGAGGTAGTAGATTGGTGGTSSFGSHCSATGGTGSTGCGARGDTLVVSPEASPGLGSGGDENYRGNPGGVGAANGPAVTGVSGNGGQSPLSGGFAGRSTTGTFSGTTGYAFGGGAEGSANGQSQAAQVGGTGGDGGIIVEEHYA